MYLKSLEVHGFKSFANKLIFEFHNGITAIVGPNGSGKSNVADAVRWVLGEQSAKQLRGAKMEDIIFAGTELRKPLGYAYVAITISNEDHKLNVPYEEVTIARRVYRSGESEYLLNGASCRLRDIQELLFDTGIGKEGYSIIGQGQIDKILSGKPEERRELFDEAAGIVKFKKRKAAAEKNLAEEQQNMVRIEDILSELEKQVGPLEKQSEKAHEYLIYRDELRGLDVNIFLMEYDQIHTEMEDVSKKQDIASADLENAKKEFEETKNEYAQVEEILETQNQSLEQNRENLTTFRVSLNEQEGNVKVLQEQIRSAGQNEEHYKERLESLQKSLNEAEEEKAGYQEKQDAFDERLAGIRREQEQVQETLAQTSSQIVEAEREIADRNDEIMKAMTQTTEIKTNQQKFETMLEQINVKRAELTKRVLENKSEAAGLQEAMEEQKAVLSDISDKIEGMDANTVEIRNSMKKLSERSQELEKEHRDTQQKFHMANSRLNSLKNMTERYEGFGQSIRRVMEQKEHNPGIIGVVADIIRVEKDYEIAIETALGGSIQNIVTDNEQTAKAMIALLKKNRYGRATFLPLTNISGRGVNQAQNILREPGVVGFGSSLVHAEARFDQLVEYLLGRFVVVDHIDHAIALAKKYKHSLRIVTKEGELLNPGGSMSGGAYKNNNNLLGRHREMENLEKEVQAQRDRMRDIVKEQEEGRQEAKELQDAMENNRKIRQELILKQNTAKINYDRAKGDFLKNQDDLDQIRLESQGIDTQKAELTSQLDALKASISDTESKSKENETHLEELNKSLEQLREEEKKLTEKNSEYSLKISTEIQSNEFVAQNIERIDQTMKGLREEFEATAGDSRQAEYLMQTKKQEIESARKQIEETKKSIEALEETIRQESENKDKLSRQHKDFIDKRESLSDKINELDKECFRLNNQKDKMEERINSRTTYMWEQYELTYHAAEELRTETELTMPQMKQEISSLKGKIKALGDVNVNAIEQYQDVLERYTQLKTQHDDLIKAAGVLEGIINELDESMRKQFAEQFAEIRERFDKVFKELFGGGRGTLELLEEEDILTAGIKIVAQPPGKKLQNMMQLSGGEKALTAIALLFAIQSLKPSPFCLLDEIEAALDDSNVDRYAQYLHKLTKDTQFIVITHRRGTMNAADILYGITMQEKGVSTLVSVNLLDEKDVVN
ncbi:chromosome segregation protein SMC [Jutongia sp.]